MVIDRFVLENEIDSRQVICMFPIVVLVMSIGLRVLIPDTVSELT
jgi:hypothetical protein